MASSRSRPQPASRQRDAGTDRIMTARLLTWFPERSPPLAACDIPSSRLATNRCGSVGRTSPFENGFRIFIAPPLGSLAELAERMAPGEALRTPVQPVVSASRQPKRGDLRHPVMGVHTADVRPTDR